MFSISLCARIPRATRSGQTANCDVCLCNYTRCFVVLRFFETGMSPCDLRRLEVCDCVKPKPRLNRSWGCANEGLSGIAHILSCFGLLWLFGLFRAILDCLGCLGCSGLLFLNDSDAAVGHGIACRALSTLANFSCSGFGLPRRLPKIEAYKTTEQSTFILLAALRAFSAVLEALLAALGTLLGCSETEAALWLLLATLL